MFTPRKWVDHLVRLSHGVSWAFWEGTTARASLCRCLCCLNAVRIPDMSPAVNRFRSPSPYCPANGRPPRPGESAGGRRCAAEAEAEDSEGVPLGRSTTKYLLGLAKMVETGTGCLLCGPT